MNDIIEYCPLDWAMDDSEAFFFNLQEELENKKLEKDHLFKYHEKLSHIEYEST